MSPPRPSKAELLYITGNRGVVQALGQGTLGPEKPEARDVPTKRAPGRVQGSLALQEVLKEAHSRTTRPAHSGKPTPATLILAHQVQREAGMATEHPRLLPSTLAWTPVKTERAGRGTLSTWGCKGFWSDDFSSF